jgi:Leucine-rich repeat (LRR) protein
MRALSSPQLASLVLANNSITGAIPPALLQIPHLQVLTLRESSIIGTIPKQISAKSLETLVLETDRMTTSIPESIGNLAQLRLLSLHMSGFSTIPESIGNLSMLQELKLHMPGLTETLPWQLGRLTSLRKIDITGCTYLSGTLPETIGNLVNLQELIIDHTKLHGPLPPSFGELQSLERFSASQLIGSGLSSGFQKEICMLKNLKFFKADSSGLQGIIPLEIAQMSSLEHLELHSNLLQGTVPPLPSTAAFSFIKLSNNQLEGSFEPFANARYSQTAELLELSFNKFSGGIPERFFRSVKPNFVRLDHNLLNGTLPDDAFDQHQSFSTDLSHNNLTGTLPSQISSGPMVMTYLKLSSNGFTGTVPPSYSQITSLNALLLDENQLSGNLAGFNNSEISTLDVSHNHLSGQLENLSYHPQMIVIKLSSNRLSGTLPLFPGSLRMLDLSHNLFRGSLASIELNQYITDLDLSYNSFTGTISSELLNIPHFLNLAHNLLSGTLPSTEHTFGNLNLLDLSYNHFRGYFENSWFLPLLVSLSLKGNQIAGEKLAIDAPRLTTLDISSNIFSFPLESLTRFPHLVTLQASGNQLRGSPSDLKPLKSLKVADLSHNLFRHQLDLKSLNLLFSASLRQLFIDNNSFLPIVPQLDPINGPWRKQQTQPSSTNPDCVECHTLTFSNQTLGLVFVFSEKQFNWQQCDCMPGFYGLPPSTCYKCPANAKCEAKQIHINSDFYTYPTHIQTTTLDSQRTTDNEPSTALNSVVVTEPCIVSLAASESNCLGLNITLENSASESTILEYFRTHRDQQCLEGSGGRLCSRCECNDNGSPELLMKDTTGAGGSSGATSISSCYYKRGFLCTKCARTYRLSQTLPVLVALAIVALVVLSALMLVVLRSRRKARERKWESLPILLRIWHRLIEASKFGFISILILFIQILAVLTHWDGLILRSLAQLLNGKYEQVGITCLFPTILSHQFASLLLQLLTPILVASFLACSVGLAEIAYRLMESFRLRKLAKLDSELTDPDIDSHTIGLINTDVMGAEKRYVDYPARALIASNTLAIFQFFYFGTSLAATEYFFADIQAHTGLKYVQAHPWMLYSDATSLRRLSIPWLIFIVIGLPISLLVFAWQIRHKIASPTVKSYVGSLFDRYRPKFFWWEATNLVKKLTIALLIRGIAATNPLQSIMIAVAICVPMLIQVAMRPWKRYLENAMDPIGGVLLFLSLAASNSFSVSKSYTVIYLVLSLDALYILAMLVLILYFFVTEKTEYQTLWEASFGNSESLDDGPHKRLDSSKISGSNEIEFEEPLMRDPIDLISD